MSGDTQYIYTKRSRINHLRTLKDLNISMNSLSLRAALKGGLPEILGYHLSNAFAVKIEMTNQLSQLQHLNDEITETYCRYVNEYAGTQHSKITKLAIDYILLHLSSHITVKEMSDALFTNPSYLSRKFKLDTGYAVSEYISREKIKQAKLLISETPSTLTEIAGLTGFNSYTNFAKVFKKETKMTPKEYRRRSLTGIE